MANEFYALMGRMRYITRWGLMRNSFSENIQEHSHQVAVLAHALALIRRDILHLDAPDPDRCAVASGIMKEPMLKALPATFSYPQLVTALIGGAVALVMVPGLRKALHK